MSDKGHNHPNSSSLHHVNKSGRKGDPRMHRAVAARLADPALTLFEALRAGGFDYAVDDDAQAIDRELVTLGQRKNQLSRRLRLAKRLEDGPGGGDAGSVGRSTGGSGGGSYHGEGRGKKRSSHSAANHNCLLDDIVEPDYKSSMMEAAPARIKAKNHPDYRGPIIVLPRSGLRQQNSNHSAVAQQSAGPTDDSRQGAVKSPAYLAVLDPPPTNGSMNAAPQNPQALLGQQPSPFVAPPFPLVPYAQLNQYASLCGLPPLTALPPAASASGSVSPAPLPSGVAVASLNSTAQRIGMTLEQLALALSQCSSLSKVLTAIATETSDHVARHETLAQNLCLTEIKSLYSRSMLLAGFTAEQAAEDSSKYLEFAVAVWQMEGKRLGTLLRAKNMGGLLGDGTGMGGATHPSDPLAGRNAPFAHRYGSSQGSHERDDSEDDDEDDEGDDEEGDLGDSSADRKPPADASNGGQLLTQVYAHRGDCPHHRRHRSHSPPGNSPHQHHRGESCTPAADGRHVHRLEGCGHKAILHQPENGPAHIDFLVGDKIECYQGLQPAASFPAESNSNSLSAWLSQYKGDDSVGGGMNASQSDEASMNLPKILDVATLDLDGKEWITAVDETLMSLCKLSDPAPGDDNEG